jgi:multidrug efflux pump subunit AcrA (membrane-fusion protein)
MEEHEKIELRSEEVQEILGTPPKWIVRWGTTIIAFAIVALLYVSWAVDYPDIIPAAIVLTTSEPPVEIVSRAEGRLLKLAVKDAQTVRAGDILVVLQSTGRYDHIQKLDSFINLIQNVDAAALNSLRPNKMLELGELAADYSTFVQLYEDYTFSKTEKSQADVSKILSMQNQISSMQRSISIEEELRKKMVEKVETARKNYGNQQKLYSENVISQRELEAERSKVLDLEREAETFKTGKLSRDIDIANVRKQIEDVAIGSKEVGTSKFVALRESISRLRSSLDSWKQKYLLTAPIDGKVSLNAEYFAAQQFVKAGDEVMTIVSEGDSKVMGRVSLPITGSGKVLAGQRVLVRLENFPYQQYGQIEGVIESKSAVPKNGLLPIMVNLPNGLRTSYGKILTFEPKMSGTAEIITENRRFIERIFDSLKSIWTNG